MNTRAIKNEINPQNPLIFDVEFEITFTKIIKFDALLELPFKDVPVLPSTPV